MLLKNFGVTRHGRVVFYDYDEIAYMTDCNFRRIPPPRSIRGRDVRRALLLGRRRTTCSPSSSPKFLVSDPVAREVFLERHADLMDPAFWAGKQDQLRAGLHEDVYPYPEEIRFRR